jgi:hypothetical protein
MWCWANSQQLGSLGAAAFAAVAVADAAAVSAAVE